MHCVYNLCTNNIYELDSCPIHTYTCAVVDLYYYPIFFV